MKPSPSYLTRNRHGTFYFRIVIPRPLRALLHGQREVRRTLKTDSERLARKRARQYVARYEAVFDKVVNMVERDELGLTEADYKELMELVPDFSSPQDESNPAEPILSDKEIEARQRRREVERLLTGSYGRAVPGELKSIAEQLLQLSQMYQPTELRRVLPTLRDELVKSTLRSENQISTSNLTTPKANYSQEMANWTMYQVWEDRLAALRADPSREGGEAKHAGTLERAERAARTATVLTQHKPVCQLTKKDWQYAYDAARRIKKGVKASTAPNLQTPVEEILTNDPLEMIGQEVTVATIRTMSNIHEHAYKRLSLTQVKISELVIPPVNRRSTEERRKGTPFSLSDLEKIFSGYIYQGPIPTDRTKAFPYWFWLPLIAYFTGARTNEIAQLDTTDIKDIDGHPCFDFCPDELGAFEAKRIKSGEARQVPVHPRLLELGLLDYVTVQKQDRQKKLFGDGLTYLDPRPKTDHNKEGWAKSATKFFNEAPKGYLVTIGVHKPNDGKSIYSFRHTLETSLRNIRRNGQGIDQTIIDAITGHVPNTIASRHYDGGATISQKLEALKLLPIPESLKRLKSYQVDFVARYGNVLSRSISGHRIRHPRTF